MIVSSMRTTVQFQGLVSGSAVKLLPEVMSPEEQEEEIRGWQRHRYRQSGQPRATSPRTAS
jgi:hypothetical protein